MEARAAPGAQRTPTTTRVILVRGSAYGRSQSSAGRVRSRSLAPGTVGAREDAAQELVEQSGIVTGRGLQVPSRGEQRGDPAGARQPPAELITRASTPLSTQRQPTGA